MVLSNILLMCGLVIESYKIKLISFFKAYENKNLIFFNLKKYLFYKIIISKKKNFFKSNFFFILIKIFLNFIF